MVNNSMIEFNFYNKKHIPFYGKVKSSIKRYEKIPCDIYLNAKESSKYVANEICKEIKNKQDKNELCILGLATGSTPLRVYKELIKLHNEGHLSFHNVITFNLDEYYPMKSDSIHSYNLFMYEHFFNHIDIEPENINIPNGNIDDITGFCNEYESKIKSYGGIDVQLLGIGRTGHIGFNEPGSLIDSKTRLITLDRLTKQDAASDFFGKENVPNNAITMGIKTILEAKRIILMAFGEGKSSIIKKSVEGEITETIPTTYLQTHNNTSIVLDSAAASELTRIKTPWLVGKHEWNNRLIRKAVVWLCNKVDKPILKLTDSDYSDNCMSGLLVKNAYDINIKVFNDLQHTITGWPGGKPNCDDSTRPERAIPFPKKIIVFSPHPDDDVISMGGTLSRLVEQGHDVHTVYQTSGSISVHDDDVVRYLDFVNNCDNILDIKSGINKINFNLLKSIIRQGEARSACRYIKIPEKNIHFLNMPFYETGTIKKNELSEKDIDIIVKILQDIQPNQIYAAGDLSDPHGTHRVCLKSIFIALDKLKDEEWIKDTYIWLYRGAWQEWDIDHVDMAVPLSPDELIRKRMSIFKHQSQKDLAMFPGLDNREFWQRSDDRNRNTADTYNKLGMAEYEAIEVFVNYKL